MFCVYCGTNNSDQSAVCLFCGQRIPDVQAQPETIREDIGEQTAKASVPAQAPPEASAAVVVERYTAESLGKTQSAPWLRTTPQKRLLLILAAGIVFIAALILFWQWNAKRISHTRRIEALMRDAGALHSKSAEFTRRLQELRSRPTTTMREYHDQCAGLESPLADANSAAKNEDVLVEQIIPEFHDEPKVLAVLNDMKRASDLNQRIQSDVRQEILLSKTLMHLTPSEQIEFFSMSIHPVQEEEKQLAAEEQQIISQIQEEGRQLPPELFRTLLSQD